MYYIIAAETSITDWIPVITEFLVMAAAVFGGAEYWKWRQAKLQAKRDAESKETGAEKKLDTLSDAMKELTGKVDHLTDDVTELKDDLILLQHANEETVKYREVRDKQDKESIIVQQAIINSLMGILRERLVENYHRCQEKGYYSKEEREVYGKMYECYTQDPFNGNGVIHQLQPLMQNMPWTEEDAKRKRPSA